MARDKLFLYLKACNQVLKQNNTGITIFKRGSKLSLRGMLPCKSGKGKSQQTISLGIYANTAGIKRAKLEAQKLGAAIALGEFSWNDYDKTDSVSGTSEYWINRFETDYFSKRDRNPKSETTWKDYQKIFKKLPQDKLLTVDLLMGVILSTKPDTRTRQKACTYINALANFAGIEINTSDYAGNYSIESLELRNIPTDKQIVEMRSRIFNPGWKYAFSLMAAYGLRNYELFYCDLNSLKKSPGHLRIVESKRNKKRERFIWCLYPEWWEQWQLGNSDCFPQVSGRTNSDLGDRVNKAFRRYGIIKPYNLRHAWAIRSIGFIPVELAAPMMDHTVDEHVRTYHRWIDRHHYDRMYQLMMCRQDRPMPPD